MKALLGGMLEGMLCASVVYILIIELGEMVGSPLPLTPLEWVVVLGAGFVLGVLDRVMALVWARARWWR